MTRGLLNWLDDRTRLVSFSRAVLYESIPGGARWRYVWGNTVLFAFVVQLITGFFLWAAYSPSTQTAWESTYYIQHQMTGGWLLRAIHHYMAQAVVILIALHIFQMVIDSAYRAPREVNFWVALVMLQLVVFFSITGWLLPWDQRGFFGSKIPTNLILLTPGIGPYLRQILIGGSEYGTHHTLTRFFSLHVGLLPWIMLVVFWVRSQQNRRHGQFPTEPAPDGKVDHFWPDQFLRNAIACLAVMAVVLFLSLRHGFDPATRGVALTAPADPSQEFSAARPELPFLWLFQMLKYFPGEREVYGAIVLPGTIMFALVMMPIIGRWRLGRGFNITLICAIGISIVTLTVMSLWEDRGNATYKASVKQANESGARVVSLASGLGVPPTGALSLARNDPFLQGPLLFKQHCAACHRHGDDPIANKTEKDYKPTAPDLKGFASREWIAALMDPKQITSDKFFAHTAHKDGEMVEFVTDTMKEYDDEKKAALQKIIVALSAEAQLKSQRAKDAADLDAIAAGRVHLTERSHQCAKCHKFGEKGGKSGPDLTGYGSRQWTIDFVKNPAHERFYGNDNDRMPIYEKQLDDRTIGLIVDWLRDDWYVPGEQPFVPPTTRPATRPTTAPTTTTAR